MRGAQPQFVSEHAKERQRLEMGTLGSGNHYLELQHVDEIFDARHRSGVRSAAGRNRAQIHCGSRGLGHQIGTEFLRDMVLDAQRTGLHLPDRELACAPIASELGQRYLGAMRAAINCALANRQIVCHLAREVFRRLFPRHRLDAAVRRLAQHLQGGTAPRRRRDA